MKLKELSENINNKGYCISTPFIPRRRGSVRACAVAKGWTVWNLYSCKEL